MRIREIEKLCQSEETLDKVLDESKELFEKVDYWMNCMRDGLLSSDNPKEVLNSLQELTGIFGLLNTIVAIVGTEKKNRETRYYNKLRMETENEGRKFVATVGDKQASESVADYRRIRNCVQAYRESCEKAISSLQSILKQIQEEMKLSGNKKMEG